MSVVSKSVKVKILNFSRDGVKVKLPFLDIPIKMSLQFFNKRLEAGYFKVDKHVRSKFRIGASTHFCQRA